MDGRPTWTDCDEAGDYVVPNVLSPRDLVFRPDNMDKTVPHTHIISVFLWTPKCQHLLELSTTPKWQTTVLIGYCLGTEIYLGND